MSGEPVQHKTTPGEYAKACAEGGGFAWQRLLHENARKQSATALVRGAHGELLIFKCVLPGAESTAQADFATERDFYARGDFALAPKLSNATEYWFAREHVDGVAIREWIASRAYDKGILLEFVSTLSQELGARRRRPCESEDPRSASRVCLGRIKNLLTSGPVGTQRSSFSSAAARTVTKSTVPLIRRYLEHVFGEWHSRGVSYTSHFAHNDLHGDNVLITPNGRPVVIDYERATGSGYWHSDALYFLATIIARLTGHADRTVLLDHAVQVLSQIEPDTRPEVGALARLFTAASLSNSRFRTGAWLDSETIMSFARLVA